MKKKVFISGITGTMGKASLKHLLKDRDAIDVISIVRDSRRNRKMMEKYKDYIDIIWGDLREYKDVKKALSAVDYIIHIAAFVSPKADHEPKRAWDINVGSTENILKAINELKLWEVRLIYIGSVAQTGSRLPPIHWGRVGDPLKPSKYDIYAVTKIAAERKIIESGLKYWVSLRQTGILHYGLLNERDGIIFHQPLDNVLEWITDEDSGRLIRNIVLMDLPKKFWKNIYNIGGGKSTRINNYNFTSKILKTVSVDDIEKIFEPYWFASKNFHGQYYLDSYILNDYLDFRRESIDDFFKRLERDMTYPAKFMRSFTNNFIKKVIMKPIVRGKNGTMSWIKNKEMGKIQAFWGSLENWKNIKTWKDLELKDDSSNPIILNHGYDEGKDEDLLNIIDMKEAALFRGGRCLSNHMKLGDLDTKLKWSCGFSHKFYASPRLILKGGHWCKKCEAPPWDYKKIAQINPFFAQVWKDENQL